MTGENGAAPRRADCPRGDVDSDGVGATTEGNADARDGETGYVHEPEGSASPHQAPPDDAFDWRGWVLVGAIVVAFLVVPAAILFLPQARGLVESLGLTLRDAYLVLPLIPAFLLGAIAVWAAVRSRSNE